MISRGLRRAEAGQTIDRLRADHRIILDLVSPDATVLDLGCGRGELLAALSSRRRVRGQGVEIDQEAIAECVRGGINVLFGDVDEGLNGYPDRSFDYVILNNCLSEVRCPEKVLVEALRVGARAVVGFDNFCSLAARARIGLLGRVPAPGGGLRRWYNTPPRRCLGVGDFLDFCREKGFRVRAARYLRGGRPVRSGIGLVADYALFLLEGPAQAGGTRP